VGNALAKAETSAKEIVLAAKEEAHQIRATADRRAGAGTIGRIDPGARGAAAGRA
jgi:F0F1-type ATP synthase membrane subunit b/b'